MKKPIIGAITCGIGILVVLAIVFLGSENPNSYLPAPDTAPTSATTLSPGTTPPEEKEQTPTYTSSTYIYEDDAIMVGGDGGPIELINNPNATNPTYDELLAFIQKDNTDKYSYICGPQKVAYVCSDFAEDVHNNAEAAGIKAAWVGIDIEGESDGHALNAFQTTDIGLVYIDCTGKNLWSESTSRSSWDRRAYVEIGHEYVVKHIDNAKTEYRFSVSIEEYLNNEPFRKALGEEIEWLRTHDISELGQIWMQNWIRGHEAELYRDGHRTEPVWNSGHISSWYAGDKFLVKFFMDASGRLYVDSIDLSWFQPEKESREVDGIPVEWKVSGGYNGLAPLGVVKDIHMHW